LVDSDRTAVSGDQLVATPDNIDGGAVQQDAAGLAHRCHA
jgi:hypothetical protein